MEQVAIKLPSVDDEIFEQLRLIQWAKFVHPSTDGYVTIATQTKQGWQERSYPVDVWYNYIVKDQEVDCYYSPNTMYKPHRLVANARHINAVYVDLDFYKYSLSSEEVLSHIDFLVETERLVQPTFVVYSGRGMYLFWQIESVPAKYKQVLKLFDHIQSFFIDTLKEQGADSQAKDVTRVLRVPTSFNTKTGEEVRILQFHHHRYTMRYLQQFMNDALMINLEDLQKPKKKTSKKKSKVKYLYNAFTLAVARANDLKKLCQLRNYDIVGYRNAFVHVYAYLMFLVHNNYHVARGMICDFNEDLQEPLSKSEIESIVKSTFKAYEGHREDISKGYNYKNETLINLLAITEEEQQQLQTIIDKKEKQRRNTEYYRQSRRSEDGLTNRQKAKEQNVKQIKLLFEQGIKKAQIAKELNVSRAYVTQVLSSPKSKKEK